MQSKDKTKQSKSRTTRIYCQSLGFSQTLYDCFIVETHRLYRSLICIVSGLLFLAFIFLFAFDLKIRSDNLNAATILNKNERQSE